MYKVIEADGDTFREKEEAALIALNERLRDDYVADCARGAMRWNQIIKRHGIEFEPKLPHRAFHRQIGQFAELRGHPQGRITTQDRKRVVQGKSGSVGVDLGGSRILKKKKKKK